MIDQPDNTQNIANDKQQLDRMQEALQTQLNLFSDFHARKESAAWTALGLYLGFVSASVAVMFTTSVNLSVVQKVLLSILTLGLAGFSIIFQRGQFELKEYATRAFDAGTSLLYKLLSGTLNVSEGDYEITRLPDDRAIIRKMLIPRGILQPNLITKEIELLYGESGSQKEEVRSQKNVRWFAYVAILIGLAIVWLSIWIA